MKRRWKKFFKGILYFILFLLMIYSVWWIRSAIVLHNAYSRLRAEGRPMTLDEVIPPYVLDGDNAAPLYLAAAAMLESESLREVYDIRMNRFEYLCRVPFYLIFRATKSLDYIEYAKWKKTTPSKHISAFGDPSMETPIEIRKGLLSGREYQCWKVSHLLPETNSFPGSDYSVFPTGTYYSEFSTGTYYVPTNEAYVFWSNILQYHYSYRTTNYNTFDDLFSLSYEYIRGRLEKDDLRIFYHFMVNDTVLSALKLAEEGTRRAGCRFYTDFEKGPFIRLDHLSKLSCLTAIICARSLYFAKKGDMQEAWYFITAGLKMADALKNEPLIMSQAKRSSMFWTCANTIYELTLIEPPENLTSSLIQNILSTFEDDRPLIKAIDGERVVFNYGMNIIFEKDKNGYRYMHPIYKLAPWYNADRARYISLMHHYAKLAVENNWDSIRVLDNEFYDSIPRYYRLVRAFEPSMQRVLTMSYKDIVKARLTHLSLAILDYHRSNGSYPDNLEQTGVQNLIDPFAGKPMIYHKESNGFIIYSVGEDQTDDGGHCDLEEPWNDKDIILRYPRPPQPKKEGDSSSNYL
jgi:hypothetical protein